jgi:hypothetical protein
MLDAIVFKKIILHFPFVNLDLSLEELGSSGFTTMTNQKLQMENEK